MTLKYEFDTMIRRTATVRRSAMRAPQRRSLPCSVVVLASLLTAQPSFATEIRVDGSVTSPGGPGTSWGNAYKYIEDAIDAASEGDEIWVKAGTYTPANAAPVDANDEVFFTSPYTGTGGDDVDRMRTYLLRKNVAMYGGFAGTETSRTQADPDTNITILSGDLGGGDIAYHVVLYIQNLIDEEPPDPELMIIDGFTITGGNANGGDDSGSDGVFNALGGGALIVFEAHHESLQDPDMAFNETSGPVFSRCVFKENAATLGGGAFAGIYNVARIIDCRFEDNHHTATSGVSFNKTSRGGGAININGPIVVLRSTFVENTSVTGGGAIHHDGVPGTTTPTVVISNCEFRENTAPVGGEVAGATRYPEG